MLRPHTLSQSTFSSFNNATSLPQKPSLHHLSLIAYHLRTCASGRPGISLQKGVSSPLRKNANEHAMSALGCVAAERQPTLPDADRDESAETSGERGSGVLVEMVMRSERARNEMGEMGEDGGGVAYEDRAGVQHGRRSSSYTWLLTVLVSNWVHHEWLCTPQVSTTLSGCKWKRLRDYIVQ
ncbi:hypothetical protein EI94DRAFT_1791346 [Lactarius quietus]|nr:hypothetical protein EI94DRAFT_1791346 [Lactarius quietus]